MKPVVELVSLTAAELSRPETYAQYEDPYGVNNLNFDRIRAFQVNPFLDSLDRKTQFWGVSDGKLVARLRYLPLRLVLDGTVYRGSAADSHLVVKQYRKSGIGIDVSEACADQNEDGLYINCGLSDLAVKFSELSGATLFFSQNFHYYFDVGKVRGRALKSIAWKLAVHLLDWAFAIHRGILHVLSRYKLRGIQVREKGVDDQEFLASAEALVKGDRHRFREDIGCAWLKWVMENDFISVHEADKKLYGFYEGERLVGFCLTRITSSNIGRIMEWQFDARHEGLEPWAFIRMAETFKGRVDVVTFNAFDPQTGLILRRLMLCPVRRTAISFSCRETSPAKSITGLDKRENWRLRPGYGDSCFS